MTNKEAKKIIKQNCYIFNTLNFDRTTLVNTALDRAITALEQEPILDKVRAEIEVLSNANPSYWHGGDMVDRDDVLEIIDKYKESEEKYDI